MLRFNFIIAFRTIWKTKMFSVVNITGLALSLACCLAIGLYIINETSFDSFHHQNKNIYRVTEKQNQAGSIYNVAVTPGPLAPALQRDFPEIGNTVRFGKWSGNLKNGINIFEEKNILLTENSIFTMFDFPLLKGNPLTALRAPNEIVISEKLAKKYFGKEWENNGAIIGQIFRLNNETDFTLAGIAKDVPGNSSIQFDVLIPLSYIFLSDEWSNKWNSNNYHTYVQLQPGTNAGLFERKLAHQLAKYNPGCADLLALQSLKKQYLYSAFDFNTDWGKRSNIKYIKIFSSVGFLLLLIACLNFVNLSTARSLKRSMEVGIRKVNGASRYNLVVQFLTESVSIALIAGLLALLIVNAAMPWLQKISRNAIHFNFTGLLPLTLFFLFTLFTGIMAGIYPAFILSSFKPVSILQKTGGIGALSLFRKGLVVAQFSIAVILITCTFFMYRQLDFMQNKNLGFDKENLMRVGLSGGLKENSAAFMQEINSVPGVLTSTAATMTLVNVDNSSYLEWDGMSEKNKFLITQANVDPNFIPALHLQLLNGSNFSSQPGSDSANYIVNESAVKHMGTTIKDVIGKQVSFWGTKGKIIGVVKDFHFKPLRTGVAPFILRYRPKERYFNVFVKTVEPATAQLTAQLQKIYKKYEPSAPFDYSFVNDSIKQTYIDEQRTAGIIFLFAALCIFVACLGLFGLTLFSAEQRTKEIGIRKVLGAGIFSISTLLTRDFLKLILIALVIAFPAAWKITALWLQDYAYRINIEASVFIIITLFVIALAVITVSVHALKAAAANPVKSLRSE